MCVNKHLYPQTYITDCISKEVYWWGNVWKWILAQFYEQLLQFCGPSVRTRTCILTFAGRCLFYWVPRRLAKDHSVRAESSWSSRHSSWSIFSCSSTDGWTVPLSFMGDEEPITHSRNPLLAVWGCQREAPLSLVPKCLSPGSRWVLRREERWGRESKAGTSFRAKAPKMPFSKCQGQELRYGICEHVCICASGVYVYAYTVV